MSNENKTISKKLRNGGYRVTESRLIILELLHNTTTHPTAEEIYNMVKPELPNISLGTVYRTLNVLEDLGLVRRLDCNQSISRYDGNVDMHYHAICLNCGKVLDVDGESLENLEERFSIEPGFKILNHKLQIYGYCKDCCLEMNEIDNE